MENSPSINRIDSTRLSLNARFTAIQGFGPDKQIKPKGRSRPSARFNINGTGSAANRKFLQQLEKKHKMETALKLKRRSLKAGLIPRGGRGKNNALALRLAPNGKVIKARSLANVATMKADLVQPVAQLQRSNSGLNLSARIGLPRRINRRRQSQIGISNRGVGRMRMRQNNNNNNNIPQNQNRGRSRSRSRTRQRTNSISNLSRRNSLPNTIQQQQQQQQQQQRRPRSRSRSRGRLNRNNSQSRSVHSRLGIRNIPIRNRNNVRGLNNKQRGIGRVARGRILKRNSTGSANISNAINTNGIKRQGRSRSRSRLQNVTTFQGQRGRSRSRGRNTGRGVKTQFRGQPANRQGRSRSTFRGGRGGQVNRGGQGSRGGRGGRGGQGSRGGRGGRGSARGGNNSNTKREGIKKEDLDKELDQYMASSNTDDL